MKKTALLIASLLLWTAAVAAQSNSQNANKNKKTPEPITTQGTPALTTRDSEGNMSGDDARIAREVRHQLLLLPYYGVFDDLAYKVENGNVTLYGYVVRPTTKSDAENVVKKIEGVKSVTNNIEVAPTSPMDDQVRRAVYRSIFGRVGLDRYAFQAIPSIHILVKNGHVTLTGVVDNEMDKNLAGMQANSVPGVFSVTNNLVVAGGERSSK
jgi:hyperosmotically inducible protein